MKFKYCPECYALGMAHVNGAVYRCNKCGYSGIPEEATMDELNQIQSKLKRSHALEEFKKESVRETAETKGEIKTGKELEEKLKRMRGQSNDDFEIF